MDALVLEEVEDPAVMAQCQAQRERYARNDAVFKARAREFYTSYRGKHLAIAGGELFVADTAEEAIAQARARYPDDTGLLIRYIPREKGFRSYANQRRMVSV